METFSGWGIHQSQLPVTRSFDGLICAWINGWLNNREAGDFRRHRTHYDVTVMSYYSTLFRHCCVIYALYVLLHSYTISWDTGPCFNETWLLHRPFLPLENLPYWGRNKMVVILQTIFSKAFGWIKIIYVQSQITSEVLHWLQNYAQNVL